MVLIDQKENMLAPSQLAIAFAGCVVGVQLLLHIYRYFTSPLRSVPGPFVARFTDLWYLKQVQDGCFEKVNRELHKKYGLLTPPLLTALPDNSNR